MSDVCLTARLPGGVLRSVRIAAGTRLMCALRDAGLPVAVIDLPES